MLTGVSLLILSFMYEGVQNQASREDPITGPVYDPEYLPPWR